MTNDTHLGLLPLDTALPSKRGRKRAAKVPQVSEAQVVRAIVCRLKISGVMVQAQPNEAASAKTAAILGRGTRIAHTVPGFPDLALIGPGGRIAWCEVKRPGFKPSGPQQKIHAERQEAARAALRERGHLAFLATSQDEVVATLAAAGWPVR